MEITVRMNEDELHSYMSAKEADEEQMAMLHDELSRVTKRANDLSDRLEMIQQWFRHNADGNEYAMFFLSDLLKAIGATDEEEKLAWVGRKKDA